ncbi:cytosolic iron-sulfur protein assembly protein 1 [Aspergillus flavus]|uniref:Probable cytosolic iron-sulfur protein assembly protein 1 n=1 Tax=Aspergillus flavus (strain ATCC 200026 / FGSC A1120 / IAM 13836 / NRRL 3357 / JCM 12722 / SRRC 167) TaxID=332952 RepID=A0A7U2QXM2_ASPFN|nr:cytosolic iron-sulfur protein assembly protein 1 [Aspergillus flavus]
MTENPTASLTLLSDLTPPSLERTWLTAPHPSLPIVATCSSDKTVRVYSLTNFRLLSTISGGHKRSVRTCAWKPHVQGESVLATGSFDATVGIWRRWDSYDDEEWRFAVLLDGHDSEVKSVSWSPSGMLLATCSRDKSIWIWEDLDDGDNNFETVAVMQEHEGDVKCVAWHPVEECLASASYDNTIRLWREDIDDWGQVACIKGHTGTVWYLDWEGIGNVPSTAAVCEQGTSLSAEWKDQRAMSGPRLASCSDDRTVRIWKRRPKEQRAQSQVGSTGIPSIIRPTGTDETWEEDVLLPQIHELSIYAVAWSKRTGLLASVGADGRIVVYEELFLTSPARTPDTNTPTDTSAIIPRTHTEWVAIAILEGAHGIYEVNHVAWARRADRCRKENEEVLITTADDGSIKVWTLRR